MKCTAKTSVKLFPRHATSERQTTPPTKIDLSVYMPCDPLDTHKFPHMDWQQWYVF
jgi:hypothetical protein